MKWEQRPNEYGVYWWRKTDAADPTVARVYWDSIVGAKRVALIGVEMPWHLNELRRRFPECQWQGPIAPQKGADHE